MNAAPYSPPDDAALKHILASTKTIAVVGVSANPVRPSYFVARYLSLRGYRVIPVNPGHAGAELFGERVRTSLSDCPDETDMVDVFRRSEHVPPIVAEAIERFEHLRTIWLQIGVESDAAYSMARAKGLNFVQNRCPKIEYQRLFGELRKGGFNTGVISSRL
ncbi:MAG: putative CoA-binding protein [Rhodobacteraceae bacterium HLUCCA12]|nr:MAG: putative CoA-binding protein [Rhodobacteraceae bacterium HLUCCA12]